MATVLGPITEMKLEDPVFSEILWKLTPLSMATRLSGGAFKPWNYVQLLSRKLVDVAMGRCPRLIVCMPPRHGKSELVSRWLPIWFLENFPWRKVILASYESDFASKWGEKVRDTILANQELLSVRFANKNPAMHAFATTKGGGMSCAGVGGPITGRGANLLLLDDLIKNREEANSLVMRTKSYDWYTSTARTRIEPSVNPDNGSKEPPAIILIATRWHEDDVIGRLINPEFFNEKGEKENWEVFVFPACADPRVEQYYRKFGVKVNDLRLDSMTGEARQSKIQSIREQIEEANNPHWCDILGRRTGDALCPDRFNAYDLSLFRGASLGDWYALYQQIPSAEAEDGNVYHRFDQMVHCRPCVRNEDWQLFASFDFNVDPMCIVIGQYNKGVGIRGMEHCEVLEEIVLSDSNTVEAMGVFMQRIKQYQWGYTLEIEIYGDAAGTQRSSQSQKSNWAIVAEHLALDQTIHYRFVRKKANPMIPDRVNAVNTMLRAADGTVRLVVDDAKCPTLVEDFKKVRWQVDSNGNTTGLLDKSDKRRTHISDSLGYCIDFRYGLRSRGGGRPGIIQ